MRITINNDKLHAFILFFFAIVFVLALSLAFATLAFAGNPHHDHEEPVANVTNVTHVFELPDITANTYNTYETDSCQGVAIAQALGNNHLSAVTHKTQASLGAGECNGEYAGSLMLGIKPNKKWPLISGSYAIDEDTESFGAGATWVFK